MALVSICRKTEYRGESLGRNLKAIVSSFGKRGASAIQNSEGRVSETMNGIGYRAKERVSHTPGVPLMTLRTKDPDRHRYTDNRK